MRILVFLWILMLSVSLGVAQQPAQEQHPAEHQQQQAEQPAEQPAAQQAQQPAERGTEGAQQEERLPQTASPLPLLALLGLVSLVAGAAARRKG